MEATNIILIGLWNLLTVSRPINSFDEIEFVELGYWKQSGKFNMHLLN